MSLRLAEPSSFCCTDTATAQPSRLRIVGSVVHAEVLAAQVALIQRGRSVAASRAIVFVVAHLEGLVGLLVARAL